MKPSMRAFKLAAAIGALLAVGGLSGCHYGHGHGYGSRSNYYYQDRPQHNHYGGRKHRGYRGYGERDNSHMEWHK